MIGPADTTPAHGWGNNATRAVGVALMNDLAAYSVFRTSTPEEAKVRFQRQVWMLFNHVHPCGERVMLAMRCAMKDLLEEALEDVDWQEVIEALT